MTFEDKNSGASNLRFYDKSDRWPELIAIIFILICNFIIWIKPYSTLKNTNIRNFQDFQTTCVFQRYTFSFAEGCGEQISPLENENTTFSSVLPYVGKNVANSDSKSDSNKFPIELSEEQIIGLEKAAKSGNYPDKQTLNELTTKLELHRSVILVSEKSSR